MACCDTAHDWLGRRPLPYYEPITSPEVKFARLQPCDGIPITGAILVLSNEAGRALDKSASARASAPPV